VSKKGSKSTGAKKAKKVKATKKKWSSIRWFWQIVKIQDIIYKMILNLFFSVDSDANILFLASKL
jgi:hypothetical protein